MYMQQPFGWLPETLCTLLPHRPASFSLVFVEVHNLAPWLWWGMESSDPKIKGRVKRMAQVSNLQDAGKTWVYLLQ